MERFEQRLAGGEGVGSQTWDRVYQAEGRVSAEAEARGTDKPERGERTGVCTTL